MGRFGVIDQLQGLTAADPLFNNITVGEVVDTNDPQQMGRVRAVCPAMGDTRQSALKDIPWAMYGSPFGGVNTLTKRGREDTESQGPVAYGMWAIPKVGSRVLIMCIDGNPTQRVWIGCIPGQFFPHTMPHGRYSDELGDGPLTSKEQPLEPLHSNITEAFSGGAAPARESFEYNSRAADNQVASLNEEEIAARVDFSETADDQTRGYTKSRIQPDLNFPNTGGVNYDSQIYSWTTPGFHALSMDDRAESSRMRFRTTAGNQIILDDTNERVYISTPQGKTWIEIDEKGTIDIYGEQDISVRSEADINMTADGVIRMDGKKGIHMVTDKEFRLHTQEDISIKTEQNLRTRSTQKTFVEATQDMHIKTDAIMYINSAGNMHIKTDAALAVQTGSTLDIKSGSSVAMESSSSTDIKAGSSLAMESSSTMDIKAGGAMEVEAGPSINMNAGTIDLNSGGSAGSASAAGAATAADPADEFQAFLVTRLPSHEPWARVYFDADTDAATATDVANAQNVEFPYDDANVGKLSNISTTVRVPKDFTRNPNWNR